MRIAMKFMLAFLVCGAVIIGAFTRLQARAELEVLEANMAQDHALMARVLRPAVQRLWEREGEERARERIDAARRDVSPVELGFAWLDDPSLPLSTAQRGELEAGHEVHWMDRPAGAIPRSHTYVPLPTPTGRMGVLHLSDVMTDEARIVRSALIDDIIATALVALLTSFVALGLGAWLVARPMAALVAQTQRIGQGDFAARLAMGSRDEFGVLAAAINTMAEHLEAARLAERREAEAKLRAVEQLRHADRLTTVGKLASGIAHELGTPLNVISMRAKMLRAGEVPEGEQGAYLESIVTQTDRLTAIVRQLLDFARRRTPARARIQLLRLAERSVQLLEPLARRAGVDLRVEGTEVEASVDGPQLEQVLTNLVVNAVHASPGRGSVTVTVREEPAAEPPQGGPPRPAVVLAVQDEGAGMPQERLERIFEPFFTTKEPGEGTGLGLSVAYGIVQDHNGWIDVATRVGAGSCFQVFLPKEVP